MNAEGASFIDPAAVLRQVEVAPGSSMADFGCGAGYFSFEFAKAVGPAGRVFALDILPAALEAVAGRAKALGLGCVTAKRANLEREGGSCLAPSSVDWVMLKDMLFQNTHQSVILSEAARVLKSGGYAIVIEWNPKASAMGPEKALRIDPEALRELLAASGLSVEKTLSVGGYHYGFLVKKM